MKTARTIILENDSNIIQAHEGDRSLLEAHEDGKDEARGGENVEKPSGAQEEIRQQRSAGLQYMKCIYGIYDEF